MRNIGKSLRILLLLTATLMLSAVIAPAWAQADGGAAAADGGMKLHYLGAALGAGMVVIGAGLGIGRFAAAAAEGVARQPQAAAQITGAVQLPLFLLEGVAVIAVVTCLLIVILK
jgi:F-type H+-transporting ATPase subunit c